MGCKEFGQHSQEDDCPHEATSVSQYSPGPVANAETLARQIFTPHHIDVATGEVNAAAFSDAKDKGLSVNRVEHTTKADLVARGQQKAVAAQQAGKEREFVGIIESSCADIRAIQSSGRRAFCVIDTALEDNTSHADVCQVPLSPKDGRSARKALMDVFSKKPTKPDDYTDS